MFSTLAISISDRSIASWPLLTTTHKTPYHLHNSWGISSSVLSLRAASGDGSGRIAENPPRSHTHHTADRGRRSIVQCSRLSPPPQFPCLPDYRIPVSINDATCTKLVGGSVVIGLLSCVGRDHRKQTQSKNSLQRWKSIEPHVYSSTCTDSDLHIAIYYNV